MICFVNSLLCCCSFAITRVTESLEAFIQAHEKIQIFLQGFRALHGIGRFSVFRYGHAPILSETL